MKLKYNTTSTRVKKNSFHLILINGLCRCVGRDENLYFFTRITDSSVRLTTLSPCLGGLVCRSVLSEQMKEPIKYNTINISALKSNVFII